MPKLPLLVLALISLFLQGDTGQLSGRVVDLNGAVVPAATVRLTSQSTSQVREIITKDSGDFSFTLLPPGVYSLEVTASGFGKARIEEVRINITQTTSVVVSVSPETVTAIVDIESVAPLVQQESSQMGRVIEGQTIRQLPLPTRNFQQLLTLSPGTSASVSNNTELGRGDAIISVNGQRTTANNVRINGIDANAVGTNATPNIAVPATDSLQEFIVQTSLYDASQGRNAGGNVEAVTRSGGNDWHGNAYYFIRNKALNENDFFLESAGQPTPVLTRHQFGGTLGGPIIRERAFFFGSYQGTRETNGASLNNSLLFPVMPAQLRDNNRSAAALQTTFGVAPNPIAVTILNLKLPNGQFAIPSAATPSGLTPISAISRFRENQFNANFDVRLSDNHTISAKTFAARNPTFQSNFNFAGLGNGPSQLPGHGTPLVIIQTLDSITDTYVINSNVVNQARFGYARLRNTSTPDEPFTAAELGITSPLRERFPGMPTLVVTGLFAFGESPFADQSSRINAFTVGDTLSIVRGSHQIRAGGEYRRSQLNFFFNAFSRGQITFASFNDFLAGNGVSIIGSGVFDRAVRINDLSGFVQDDWKFSRRLTLNLGLRYDFFGFPSDIRGRFVNFLPEQFRQGTVAVPAGPPNGFVQAEGGSLADVPEVDSTLVPSDKNNFSPRIGFALRLNRAGSVVLRGGYGIYYDRFSARFANTQLLNYPYFALAVGLPGLLRTFADPFIPVPQPGAFPLNPTIPSPLAPLAPIVGVPISGLFVDPELSTPYVQQYNTNIQWEIFKDYLLEVGYVGSKGTKLLQVVSLTQPVYNRAANVFVAPFGPALSTQKMVANGIQQTQTSANSRYNSLQISMTKRFSRGLQFLAAYTLGKSNDYYSGGTINELFAMPGDQLNWKLNYGPSDFDRRHRLVTSFVFELPKLSSDNRAAKALLNNWQVNGILTLQTGLPFTIIDSPNLAIIQRANFASGANNLLTGGDIESRLNQYFNTSAFVLSRPLLGGGNLGTPNNPTFDPNHPFGNTPRNFLYGPGQKNLDFSVVKFIPVKESLRAELRAEFFNLFNWTNFANPNTNIAVPATFGRITATSSGPRVIQLAIKVSH
ncbi:MAG TPA: carboxypeptidase regulatory-like domain-containing protein [Pyrinomonadaceae bacterium]|nr:carboxypeptidase regulatory-like domain-containing protein [Pyrinomonadaceae bacterium]